MITVKNRINTFLMSFINKVQYPFLYHWYKNNNIPVYGCFERILFSSKKSNLGDDLNIDMMESFTKRKVLKADYNRMGSQNYSFIGSILENVCKNKDVVYVWGSGFKYNNSNLNPIDIAKNKYYAVRGPKTRDIILKSGGNCPEIYGDPVLLINRLYNPDVRKKYKIGIIPHFHDYPLVKSRFVEDSDFIIIDIQHYKNWKDVINLILSCEYIISSSLHGIIIADAYSIPNVWAKFSDWIDGDGFKYEDYFLGVGKKVKCIDMSGSFDNKFFMESVKSWQKPTINEKFILSCPVPLFF